MRSISIRKRVRDIANIFALFWMGTSGALLARGQTPHQWTEAENYGFKGPVRTIETTSATLDSATKADPFFTQPVGPAWMEFDSHGSLLAEGQDLSKRKEVPRNIHVYDGQGRLVTKGVWAGDGVTLYRQEYKYGPFGPLEVRWYAGKTFTGRTVVEYDANGNFIRDASYDAEGKLQHESLQREDPRTNAVEEEGLDADGTSQVHVVDQSDPKAGIYEHQSLDPQGHVVGILRMHDGDFLSWWQSPDFQCAAGQGEVGIFNGNDEKRRFQIYFTLRCPRTLEITKLHHAGKQGSIENDLEERYLEDGTVLARVQYEYERDAHENWTRRVVAVWNAKEDKMIAVREDRRTISYFEGSKAE